MKTEAEFIRFKSAGWFELNGWKDFDQDWWPSEKAYKEWDNSSTDASSKLDQWVLYQDVGKIVSIEEYKTTNPKWGIKEEITKEEYPEYYL